MKRFSKLNFLAWLGLFDRRFNYETGRFEKSASALFKCYLALFLRMAFALRLCFSSFFDRQDPIQLIIGNVYNYVKPDTAKNFLSGAAVVALYWMVQLHYTFNHLNVRNDYYLFRRWMCITYEIPAKREKNYDVVGLSRELNKRFWLAEDRFNSIWYRVLNYSLVIFSCVINVQHFFVRFEGVHIITYIFFTTINIAHGSYFAFSFIHSIYSVNLFYVQLIRFICTKFQYLSKQLKQMNASKSKKLDTRKVSRLIVEYNAVHLELIQMNAFFSGYVGANLILFLGFGISVTFSAIFTDFRLKVCLLLLVFGMYITIVLIPSVFANSVPIAVNRVKFQFENIAFRRSLNLKIKQKISTISDLGDKTAGFSCFSWFKLSSFTGIKISLEFVIGLLLLIQAYFLSKFGTPVFS